MAESNGNSSDTAPESVASTSSAAPVDPGAHDLIVENVGDDHAAGARAGEDLMIGDSAEAESAPAAQSADDLLRLADLLLGEQDGNLDALLAFTSDGVDTTLHVAGHDSAARGADIVLRGVGDLTGGGNLSASTIVADLLKTFGPDSV
jgi:hypothetical protein